MDLRLRTARIAAGLPQLELARRAGISRQALLAIESGRSTPSVTVALALARVVGASVEDLFGGSPERERVRASEAVTGRAVVAHVEGRWVAHALPPSDGGRSAGALAAPAERGCELDLFDPMTRAKDTVLLAGCAPALGVLSDRLNATVGAGVFRWLSRSSHAAVAELAARRVHVAGTHLVDARGEPSVEHVARSTEARDVVIVTLAHWEMGLVVARGNPLGLRDEGALARGRLRMVAREKGSGARKLLDAALRRARPRKTPRSNVLRAGGHLEVAHAIAMGAADVGVATRDAAIAHDLSFVPLSRERFDLALAANDRSDPRIARMLDALTSGAWRRELVALGYDVSRSGDVVAQVRAA